MSTRLARPYPEPSTPDERVHLALSLSASSIFYQYVAHFRQKGASPIVIVALADCAVGERHIFTFLGKRAFESLTGPAVIAVELGDFIAGRSATEVETIHAQLRPAGPGALRLVLAVNDDEERVVAIPEPSLDALAECSTPAGAAAYLAAYVAKQTAKWDTWARSPAMADARAAVELALFGPEPDGALAVGA